MSFSDTPDFIPSADKSDTAIPRFYTKPVQNNFKSEQEGRPVFEDRDFVEILVPGDRKTVSDGFVRDEHKRRWPRHYAAFKAQSEIPLDGTPVEQWASITRSQAEELKFAHVRTVEQLAALPDDALNKTMSMGGYALREKAQRHLEALAGSAPMEKLAAENAAKDAKIAAMDAQMKDLLARVDAMTAAKANAS